MRHRQGVRNGFEDIEAERKALDHAMDYPSRIDALAFLVSWPALDRAARRALEHTEDLDGHDYSIRTPAANAPADRYPLAATLTLRAMIDCSLKKARSNAPHRSA